MEYIQELGLANSATLPANDIKSFEERSRGCIGAQDRNVILVRHGDGHIG